MLAYQVYTKHCVPSIADDNCSQSCNPSPRICPQVTDQGLNNGYRPLGSHRHETT